MMGNGGKISVEPPEELHFLKIQSAQSESLMFIELDSGNLNTAVTSPVLGAFSFDFPSNNYQVIIQNQADTLLDLDSLSLLYEDINAPWVNSQKYPYLFASIFLGYYQAGVSGIISPTLAPFVKDLAEYLFKTVKRVSIENTAPFTESSKYDIRTPIIDSFGFHSPVTTIKGEVLGILWEYSEQVRKGEI